MFFHYGSEAKGTFLSDGGEYSLLSSLALVAPGSGFKGYLYCKMGTNELERIWEFRRDFVP